MTPPEADQQSTDAAAVSEEPPTSVDDAAIAARAHEIAQSSEAGTDEENWLRAERELRGT